MSGIEIVGLVVGILPLFVGAATAYQVVLDPVIKPEKSAMKIADFYRDLHFEVTILQEILKGLQDESPAYRPRSDSGLGGTAARDVLSERLGGGHDTFLNILYDSLRRFNHIVSDQDLKIQGSTPHRFPAIGERLLALEQARLAGVHEADLIKRIRFGTKDHKRQSLVKKLKDNNEKLERLLNLRSLDIGRLKTTRDRHDLRTGRPSLVSRDILGRLYDAIAPKWRCEAADHEAMVSLKCCCSWTDTKSEKGHDLRMVISTHSLPPRVWQESRLSLIKAPTVQPRQPARVERFCPLVHRAQQNNAQLCVEYDGKELWHVMPTRPTRDTFSINLIAPRTTLNELLAQSHHVSLKQKRILAVILAQGLLHFGENRWLDDEWNNEHVSFLRDATDKFDLARPYIATKFPTSLDDTVGGAEELFSMHPNSSVLSLGILLLEINLWKGIDNFRASEDLTDGTTVNANTNLTTAERLRESGCDDVHEEYNRAVDACLKCDFASEAKKPTFKDEAFRTWFYDNVLDPLEVELDQVKPGIKLSEL